MSTNQVERFLNDLLEDVGRASNDPYPYSEREAVLERRVKQLLEAGQAMRDLWHINEDCEAAKAWDAAIAAAAQPRGGGE